MPLAGPFDPVKAAAPVRRDALRDLDEYLALFPDDALAARMRALLAGEGP